MYTRGYKVLLQLLNYYERGNATFGRLQGILRVQGLCFLCFYKNDSSQLDIVLVPYVCLVNIHQAFNLLLQNMLTRIKWEVYEDDEKLERRSLVGSILHTKSKVVMLGCSNRITCGGLQATFIFYNTFSASFQIMWCPLAFIILSLLLILVIKVVFQLSYIQVNGQLLILFF